MLTSHTLIAASRNGAGVLALFVALNLSLASAAAEGQWALHFDGSDDRAVVPRSALLEPTDQLTIECWAKAESGGESECRLIRKAGHFQAGYILAWQQAGAVVQLRLDRVGGSQLIIVPDPLPNHTYFGQWHHFAGVYSAAEGKASLYVDGLLVATKPASQPLTHSVSDLIIGNGVTDYETFKGVIDEVRIWKVARTQAQIQSDRGKILAGCEKGLVGYWKLDEGAGQVIGDASLSGLTGRLGSGDSVDTQDPTWVASDLVLSTASQADTDGDGHRDGCDNCAGTANPDQEDLNANGMGVTRRARPHKVL